MLTMSGALSTTDDDDHSVALGDDGTVVTWGDSSEEQRDGSPTSVGFVAIACGCTHSVALRYDGAVVTWGNQLDSQRDDAPTGAGFVAIACGWHNSVGLRHVYWR